MTRHLLWVFVLCGCAFDLSALGPRDGGLEDATVEDAQTDAPLADADLDSGSDSGLEDSGTDSGIEDSGTDGDLADAGTDAPDAYVCERATEDSSDIGFPCSACTGQPGYECLMAGAVSVCQVRCEADCNCPVGWECREAGSGDFICQN